MSPDVKANAFRLRAGLSFLSGGLFLVVLGWWGAESIPWPQCGFRFLTGYPCPFCNGIHALCAIGRGDLGAAIRFSPFVVVGLVMSVGWMILTLYRPEAVIETWRKRRCRYWAKFILVVLLLLNWIYLLRIL
jgi:hypothetical protein